MKFKKNLSKLIPTSLFLIPFVALILFQNCGGFNSMVVDGDLMDLASVQEKACLTNIEQDACIIEKNSTYANGEEQTFGVKISSITTSGRLDNSNFIVRSMSSAPPLQKHTEFGWRYDLDDEFGTEYLGQIQSFYWANYAVQNAILQTGGAFFADDQQIRIATDDDVFGWVPEKNQIHLQTTSAGNSMALDASVVVYFVGWANVDYATQGNINVVSQPNHIVCGPAGRRDCCASKSGCARAISSAAGDYLVGMTFPQAPATGDGWTNNLNGMTICSSSIPRNPNLNSTATSLEFYNACASKNQSGNIYSMGAFYASIWWNVKKRSDTVDSEIDRLFMLHLEKLNGDDTFQTAIDKAVQLDQQLFGSRNGNFLKQELLGRGE